MGERKRETETNKVDCLNYYWNSSVSSIVNAATLCQFNKHLQDVPRNDRSIYC